jgi:hypothetical protein
MHKEKLILQSHSPKDVINCHENLKSHNRHLNCNLSKALDKQMMIHRGNGDIGEEMKVIFLENGTYNIKFGELFVLW